MCHVLRESCLVFLNGCDVHCYVSHSFVLDSHSTIGIPNRRMRAICQPKATNVTMQCNEQARIRKKPFLQLSFWKLSKTLYMVSGLIPVGSTRHCQTPLYHQRKLVSACFRGGDSERNLAIILYTLHASGLNCLLWVTMKMSIFSTEGGRRLDMIASFPVSCP